MDYWEDSRRVAHASHTKRTLTVLMLCLFLTVVDLLSTLFVSIPCLRSLYARQNNADYSRSLQEQEITALQQQCALLEKELRLRKQDAIITTSINNGGDYVPPKE